MWRRQNPSKTPRTFLLTLVNLFIALPLFGTGTYFANPFLAACVGAAVPLVLVGAMALVAMKLQRMFDEHELECNECS
jgi:hypothetical protein